MRASKTHFEQIPVETVRKIAKEFHGNGEIQDLDEFVRPQERWRLVAEQVQQEQDAAKLTALVQQLLDEFDARDLRRGPGLIGANRL